MEYSEVECFLNGLDWKDLDNNPSICRAEISNEDIEFHLNGLRKFQFNGIFFSVESIDSDSFYLVAY